MAEADRKALGFDRKYLCAALESARAAYQAKAVGVALSSLETGKVLALVLRAYDDAVQAGGVDLLEEKLRDTFRAKIWRQ